MPHALDEALQSSSEGEELSPAAVVDYLFRHPRFLADRPELFITLSPPPRWTGDRVVDLQQHMVKMLRGEVSELRDCAEALIETSRINMATQARTHTAILELMSADSLATLVHVIEKDIPTLLAVDAAVVVVEPEGGLHGTVARLPGEADDDGDVLLISDLADDGTLFYPGAAIRSAACARFALGDGERTGLFALGSRTLNDFHGGQGTELFRFLAAAVGMCFRRLAADAL